MFLFVLACLLATWIPPSLSAGTTTISKEPFKLFIQGCQSESGATRADLDSIKMRKLPNTKSGRCFLQCLFNRVKIMDDGKFNKYGMVIAFSPAMKGDLTKMGNLKELSEVCDREMGGRRYENCEGVRKLVECVARNGKAYGISFGRPKNES